MNKLPPKVKRLLLLSLNTVLAFALYRTLLYAAELTDETFYSFAVMVLYMALLLGFVLAYLIYNRFLYRKGITAEQLPDSMSPEEKEAFIADGQKRLEKSRWMMLIILPLVFVFLVDCIDLFVLEPFQARL